MRRLLSLLIIFVMSFSFKASADEGMWLLPLLEKLNMGKMTELGLKLSAEEIYSLNQPSVKDAIVIFGGGCTGEIVSSKGLLLTNHHCGYGAIQSHSTVEHDYLTNGFWAKDLSEELANQRLAVTFLVSIKDVTDLVLKDVTAVMSEEEFNSVTGAARTAIANEASKDNHYRTTVASYYGGNNYYLLVYEVYSDVRLVGTPPNSIGKFGHDTDNWEWPRHTGDFSVFRVYMSPDGKPASYSKDNVPLKPRHYLPVSTKGVEKGDFAMILGYPGGTQRYMTSFEIDEVLSITHPNRIKIRGTRQEILMADMMADPKVNIQYASKYSGSSNYWKFSIGQKAGLERLKVKDDKLKTEAQFMAWMNADPARVEKYGTALDLIKSSVEARAEILNAQQYAGECIRSGAELISFAARFGGFKSTLEGGDSKKIAQQAEMLKEMAGGFYKDYNAPTDHKSVKAMVAMYKNDIGSKYYPSFFQVIDKKFKGSVDKWADDMFAKSIFADEAKLYAFLAKPDLKVLLKDPAYTAGISYNEMAMGLMAGSAKFDLDLQRGRRLWIAGLKEMMPGQTQYPDANFTMRLSYGSVLDYEPRDGVIYKYYTTLEGVASKFKPGDYEFDLPERLLELEKAKDYGKYASPEGDLVVCFITNNDITGGNSGSPVINDKGELIGLAFDGNWEAMSGDIAFSPALQRTIVVDIRYVLWVIDVYSGAGHLVDEMTIR